MSCNGTPAQTFDRLEQRFDGDCPMLVMMTKSPVMKVVTTSQIPPNSCESNANTPLYATFTFPVPMLEDRKTGSPFLPSSR